jgi:hypothetical protein
VIYFLGASGGAGGLFSSGFFSVPAAGLPPSVFFSPSVAGLASSWSRSLTMHCTMREREAAIVQGDRTGSGRRSQLARKCYRREIAAILFSSVSSSGEGCPGVLDSKEFGALFEFLAKLFPAQEVPTSAHTASHSFSGRKRLKPIEMMESLRRGWKPRPFKSEAERFQRQTKTENQQAS